MSRTITIEKEIFKYEELSEQAKERVRIKNGEFIAEFETENLKYDFEEILKEKYPYFEKPDFVWSLSNSQGDGLSFSSDFSLTDYLFIKYPCMSGWKHRFLIDNIHVHVRYNNGHYCYAHKSCIDIEFNFDYKTNTKRIDKLIDKLLNDITNEYLQICKEFEKQGYKAYEYLYSDEYAKELAESNEYEYDCNGNIF